MLYRMNPEIFQFNAIPAQYSLIYHHPPPRADERSDLGSVLRIYGTKQLGEITEASD
jgi:hypothetical protein